MMTRHCPGCGRPRKTGSRCKDCNQQVFLDEFQFLVRTGMGWGQIAAQLGKSPESVERKLHGAGRHDLVLQWRAMVGDGGTFTVPGSVVKSAAKRAAATRSRVKAAA